MEFTAVYHKTSEQMSYPLDEEKLVVNLKTGYDVRKVFIHHGDPFETGILGGNEAWKGNREEIHFKKKLKNQLWWTTTLRPEYKRCKYYFELRTKDEIWFYFEDGFVTEDQLQLSGKMLQCFTVPWMNPADINRTPEWVNKTIWYQIFPDRFYNASQGEKDSHPGMIVPWRQGPVTNEECFGGNLDGIREKLPYLEDLGINGIYLNPIFAADSNHKYDTRDYTCVDPSFGDEESLKRLVKEAHSRGIRIMLDGVFNHCGPNFKPWKDVLAHGTSSAYYNWFMIQEPPVMEDRRNTRDGAYYSFAFCKDMPKLNTNNPEVIKYFCDVCSSWVSEYEIDGIRFDVGNEISHKFLKSLRERLKAIKPDLYLLGEIWHDASQWLLGDEYDSVMNYPLTSSINDFFLDKSLEKSDFEAMINRCYTMYMQQSNNVLFNLLDSHDTDRLISRVKDIDIFYQQLAILFTMPGSPCIYYGTEIAMEGAHDPDCRRCMPWDSMEDDRLKARMDDMKQLIKLRKNEDTFSSLHFHFPNERKEKRLVEYIKLNEQGDMIQVLLNCCETDVATGDGKAVLYQRKFKNQYLAPGGTLIRRI